MNTAAPSPAKVEEEPIALGAADIIDDEEILDAELAEDDTEWDGTLAQGGEPQPLDLADLED